MGKEGAEFRSEGADHRCEACAKPHHADGWHYRHTTKGARVFICKPRYDALKSMEQARWLPFDGQ